MAADECAKVFDVLIGRGDGGQHAPIFGMSGDYLLAKVIDFIDTAELAKAVDGGIEFFDRGRSRGVGREDKFSQAVVGVFIIAVGDGFEQLLALRLGFGGLCGTRREQGGQRN